MALGISSSLEYRTAAPSDAAQCVELRGKTRENAVSPSRLAALGVTIESWSDSIRTDVLPGVVCESSGQMVGYRNSEFHRLVLPSFTPFDNGGV